MQSRIRVRVHIIAATYRLIITPLVFLGGTFYSIDMLPTFWQKVSLLNPILYLVNGTDGQYLLTGDACNNLQQFETGIGPGYYSSDREGAQQVLEQIIAFKEQYPEVTLVYGHDLKTN